MPTSQNLAFIFLIIGLALIPLNYQHYSNSYTYNYTDIIEMLKEFSIHLNAFNSQFYDRFIKDYNGSFEDTSGLLYALIFSFKKFFINYISLIFIGLATIIKRKGTQFQKIKAPFEYTAYFYIFYFALKFGAILSF